MSYCSQALLAEELPQRFQPVLTIILASKTGNLSTVAILWIDQISFLVEISEVIERHLRGIEGSWILIELGEHLSRLCARATRCCNPACGASAYVCRSRRRIGCVRTKSSSSFCPSELSCRPPRLMPRHSYILLITRQLARHYDFALSS